MSRPMSMSRPCPLKSSPSLRQFRLFSAIHRPSTSLRGALLQANATQPAAFITGCSTGIGREVCRSLADQGWKVFSGVRTEGDARSLQLDNSSITPVLIDVTSADSIAEAERQVAEELGSTGLRLLVNNAGVGLVAPIEVVPLQQWRHVIDVNLQGPFAVTQAFLPLLQRCQPVKGRIINISSVAGHLALPFWSAYNVSKSGLDILTECMRYELAPQGMSVVLIKPGPVQTPIWGKGRQKSSEVAAGMCSEAQERYGAALEKMKEFVNTSEQDAVPVTDVVAAVMTAATTQQPEPVYLVGKGAAWMYWAKRLLPDRVWIDIMQRGLS